MITLFHLLGPCVKRSNDIHIKRMKYIYSIYTVVFFFKSIKHKKKQTRSIPALKEKFSKSASKFSKDGGQHF